MDIPQSDSIAGFLYASQNPAKLIGWICMKFTLLTGKEAVTRYFANSLYPKRVPLCFFAFSASDEPVTLSKVTLALRHLSKNAVFDAKPPVSEAVTLSPSRLFFVNRPFVHPLSQILNVTASNIFLSVK